MVIKATKDIVTVAKKCPICQIATKVEVPEEDYSKYRLGGMLIQDALPNVPAPVRETLISGMCPDCQKIIFGWYDEDEDE